VKYLLDTNAVSLLMKGDSGLTQRLRRVAKTDISLPQPVIAEVEYGLDRLPSSKRKDEVRQRFDLVLAELGHAIWNDEVSRAFGAIKAELERKGQRLEDFDVAIAAHAVAHKAVLVTANIDQMSRVQGLTIEDWGASE
jgi:tRNA(fMet)-specific endonuclease VapC